LNDNISDDWKQQRDDAMRLLQQESELEEIVRLVGVDALSAEDRLVLEVSKSIREDYLHQNAFHDVDTYASLHKQNRLMRLILNYYNEGFKALKAGANMQALFSVDARERIGRAKYIPEDEVDAHFDEIEKILTQQIAALTEKP
jgi:V/A-type H+-transporting ATPase subunit A